MIKLLIHQIIFFILKIFRFSFLQIRLKRINEQSSVQQMPRRRSNSLPIPKIEVSIYQSPETKKKDDGKEIIEVPDTRDTSVLAGKINHQFELVTKFL